MPAENKKKYRAERIIAYVVEILKRHGVPEKKASLTASVLVEADLRGIFSHGINTLDLLILPSLREGGADPLALPEDRTRNKKYPIRHIDAHGDLGHPVAFQAVEMVKDLAREYGLGKVYVFNANHFGIAAVYSEKICAEKDLAGRVTCTTPAVVIPYGGKKARLGTNLVCWSIPHQKGVVTIDMATTIHAVSGILKALVEGKTLPFPVLDKGRKETVDPRKFKDPDDFLRKGAMIPLGGIGKGGADAGYKGTGLAMLIELDSVIGGGFSGYVNPTVHDKRRWIRQSFEAWRIDTYSKRKDVLKHITETIEEIRKNQGSGMLLPGEMEIRKREVSLREGIPYLPEMIKRLEIIGKAAGLEGIEKINKKISFR